jgi:tRNA 2-thiocytidine biosynthesis protein TtcA
MGRITPSHLMDRQLFAFATLAATGLADPDGDKAFDDDTECAIDPAGQRVPVRGPLPR